MLVGQGNRDEARSKPYRSGSRKRDSSTAAPTAAAATSWPPWAGARDPGGFAHRVSPRLRVAFAGPPCSQPTSAPPRLAPPTRTSPAACISTTKQVGRLSGINPSPRLLRSPGQLAGVKHELARVQTSSSQWEEIGGQAGARVWIHRVTGALARTQPQELRERSARVAALRSCVDAFLGAAPPAPGFVDSEIRANESTASGSQPVLGSQGSLGPLSLALTAPVDVPLHTQIGSLRRWGPAAPPSRLPLDCSLGPLSQACWG